MENSKLMTPLFYDGNFNREGHRMRAVFKREVTDGVRIYRLWRKAGKPDVKYPRAEKDKYILHVEINGYLASLLITDLDMLSHCGFDAMEKYMYGGREKRKCYYDSLDKSEGDDAIHRAREKENEAIRRYGNDPAIQTEYIHSLLNENVRIYLRAKEDGGQTFPDFLGALVMNDLARCMELYTIHIRLNQ